MSFKAVKFKNWSDESFSWAHDGNMHEFPAGIEIFLEDFKAVHFAKHLADRELNKLGLPTNDPSRSGLESKCFPSSEVVSAIEAIDVEEKKKEVKKKVSKKAVKEEEFADLNENE